MSDQILPSECAECGRDLDDSYEIEIYHVENPAKSGFLNPVTRRLLDVIGSDTPRDLHYPTCPTCEPPETPPAPSRTRHQNHLIAAGFVALLTGWGAVAQPAAYSSGDVAVAAVAAVVFGAVALGEYLQIARLSEREKPEWERKWDVEPVLADDDSDPAREAREAYLYGEIDEDELERRLDEELAEEERDRETRVMER